MTVHYVVARHDSAEAISDGYEIATPRPGFIGGARNDNGGEAQKSQ